MSVPELEVKKFFPLSKITSGAGLSPIFEYDFPASWDGRGDLITDQSDAGHDAIILGDLTSVDDVPAGRNGTSVNMGSFKAGAYLMLNADIAANEGLTIDFWFKPGVDDLQGKNAHNILNHGRWDAVRLKEGKLLFRSGKASGDAAHTAEIVAGQWYHVLIELDPSPYPYSGGKLTTDLSFTVNGVKQEFPGWIKSTQGDSNNQPEDGIVFGRHPFLHYPYTGLLHDIKFSFGIQGGPAGESVQSEE